MGTNYYLKTNICACCGRYDELHIGKSSVGWQFSFRAFEGEIESWSDWKGVIKAGKGIIYNEYGSEVSFDEFKKTVEDKKRETFLNHTKEMRKQYSQGSSNCFLDDEGYSFSYTEFS